MTLRDTLFRSAAIVGALGAVARFAGAAAGILLAYRFGAGHDTDAYLLAKVIPVGVYLILDSVLYNTLVPLFRRAPDPASFFRHSVLFALGTGMALACAAGLGAAPLIGLLAPGADPATQAQAVALLQLAAWAILFAVPASCLKAWNASRDRYVAASLDGGIISGLLLATLLLSPRDAGVLPITAALPAAFVALLAVQAWLARTALLAPAPRTGRSDFPWRAFRRPVPPLLALNAAQQAQVWVAVMLAAGFGAGSVSQMHYSYGIAQIPVGIIDLVLFSTLFPFAAGLAARDDRARLAQTFRAATTALILFCVPLALWVTLSRQVIVDALLLRGLFDVDAGRQTAALLLGHAIALPGWCLEALGCRMLFALDRHARYLGIVLFRLAVFLLLSAVLLPVFGLPGLSLSFAGAFTASGLLAVFVVGRALRPAGIPGRGALRRPGMVLVAAAAAIIAAHWACGVLLPRLGLEHAVALLAVRGALAGGVLAGVLLALYRHRCFLPEPGRADMPAGLQPPDGRGTMEP